MKEQLIHILDQSVCLSRKQMKEYLSGTMLPEETHASEVHLSSCPLCSLAMEGFSEHSDKALEAIAALNSGFLKDHFANISPQIHLNSIAPAATLQMAKSDHKRTNVQPLWRVGSIAAAMLLLFGLIWAFERTHNREASVAPRIAMNSTSEGSGNNGAGGTASGSNNGTGRETSGNNNGVGSSSNALVGPLSQQAKPATTENGIAATNKGLPTGDVSGKGVATSSNATLGSAAVQGRSGGSMAAAGNVAIVPPATPQSDASGNMALKEPPATKTFVEYDPSANEQNEKKEQRAPTAEASAAKSTSGNAAESKSRSLITQSKPTDTRDDVARGDDSYSKGSYGTALAHYKKAMTSSDERIRYQSMVMAAQCYAALGNKSKAEELLQRVIDNGPGPDRRAARRALRKLK